MFLGLYPSPLCFLNYNVWRDRSSLVLRWNLLCWVWSIELACIVSHKFADTVPSAYWKFSFRFNRLLRVASVPFLSLFQLTCELRKNFSVQTEVIFEPTFWKFMGWDNFAICAFFLMQSLFQMDLLLLLLALYNSITFIISESDSESKSRSKWSWTRDIMPLRMLCLDCVQYARSPSTTSALPCPTFNVRQARKVCSAEDYGYDRAWLIMK
jgi:hypothetical protein